MEYALEAVKQGSAAVGLKSSTHAVILALNVFLIFLNAQRSPSELASYQKKLFKIDAHLGIAIAGLWSDARVLRYVQETLTPNSNYMRAESLKSRMIYNRHIPVSRIVHAIGDSASSKKLTLSRSSSEYPKNGATSLWCWTARCWF